MNDSPTDEPEEGDDLEDEAGGTPEDRMTKEDFLLWRTPRRGLTNPAPMDNPVWEWLIRSRWNAWQINRHFEGPGGYGASPGWCFERFGQTSTTLPDGRTLLIGGEHEDYYDPDFYIYNDLVVRHPDGRIQIFGYPEEDFPPTDFHTATLVDQRVILIGNLGYGRQRQTGHTQALSLDLRDFSIARITTTGTSPGWIHNHTAALSDDGASILIRGGLLDRGEDPLVENIDDWRLILSDWRWERLTAHNWVRVAFSRADGKSNHLWEISQAVWSRKVGWKDQYEKGMAKLATELGHNPDLEGVKTLFLPEVPHEALPEVEDEFRIRRIKVEGVVVRYVESGHEIQMTVEGALPEPTIEALAVDLAGKFSRLENAEIARRKI
jgi:hypothetical protein